MSNDGGPTIVPLERVVRRASKVRLTDGTEHVPPVMEIKTGAPLSGLWDDEPQTPEGIRAEDKQIEEDIESLMEFLDCLPSTTVAGLIERINDRWPWATAPLKRDLYSVVANLSVEREDGWTRTTGVPTFFLDSSVQGITNEAHAESIARDILLAFTRAQGEDIANKHPEEVHIAVGKQ